MESRGPCLIGPNFSKISAGGAGCGISPNSRDRKVSDRPPADCPSAHHYTSIKESSFIRLRVLIPI